MRRRSSVETGHGLPTLRGCGSEEGLSRPVPEGTPFRDPAPGDRRLLTRRAAWLTVLHLLVPGSAQTLAGSRRLGRVRAAALAARSGRAGRRGRARRPAAAGAAQPRHERVRADADPGAARRLGDRLGAADARHGPPPPAARGSHRSAAASWAGCSRSRSSSASGGAAWGTWASGVARGTIGSTFANTRLDLPANGRYNILLLGGDAGPGRSGLRPDSISVVSLNARDRRHGDLRAPARHRSHPVRGRLADAAARTRTGTAPAGAATWTSASSTRSTPRRS